MLYDYQAEYTKQNLESWRETGKAKEKAKYCAMPNKCIKYFRGPWVNLRIIFELGKGQLISKCLFGVL